MNCEPANIPTLDGRLILLPIDEIISPKTVKMLSGEGMPIRKQRDIDAETKGDLYV